MKGSFDLALATGWNAEYFAREKRMKPLHKYLEPKLSEQQQREKGARDVLRMLRKLAKKQKKEGS